MRDYLGPYATDRQISQPMLIFCCIICCRSAACQTLNSAMVIQPIRLLKENLSKLALGIVHIFCGMSDKRVKCKTVQVQCCHTPCMKPIEAKDPERTACTVTRFRPFYMFHSTLRL